jgi:hypothetical protein
MGRSPGRQVSPERCVRTKYDGVRTSSVTIGWCMRAAPVELIKSAQEVGPRAFVRG